jgi:hypothetical protein
MAQAKKLQLTQGIIGALASFSETVPPARSPVPLVRLPAVRYCCVISRDAESEADLMGTQILFDAGI